MNSLQIKASNPEISTWVSASAGTGKTKILTDRVLRLLLDGALFDKILCLTFTNAAAAEMKERISASLEKWANLDFDQLHEELLNVTGRACSKSEVSKAQKLYELYLQSDQKLNIQTIHSFCQKILKKFPLEAGISPSFRIMDESKSYSILQHIKKKLLSKAELEHINDYLIANFHEVTIDEIFSEIVQQKIKFLNSKTQTTNTIEESIELIQELEKNTDQNYRAISEHPDIQHIVGFASSATDLKRFFLNKSGQKRKKVVTKKIAEPGSNLYDELAEIQHEVFLLDQKEKTRQLELYSKLLSILAQNLLDSYESHKSKKGLLDYDDLIIYTSKLLKSSSAKEWVLYKLDGGIEHLLVDEAQDTSPHQWQIIETLIEEFYSGESASTDHRTVFVVGDEKQSIFSFQGADVSIFTEMNKLLKERMISGGKVFEDINLEMSYRSAKEILETVHHVFAKIKSQMPVSMQSELIELTAHRTEYSGCVELWPLAIQESDDEKFWPIAGEPNISSKVELAENICNYIEETMASEVVLPSTKRKVALGDFMILFRKRDEFTKDVINALKNRKLEVTGLDRISLAENLAVRDLLSLAKFAINSDDDLNLASLLKSPLIKLSEDELCILATNRGKNSIWEYIQENQKKLSHKLEVFREIYNKSDVTNFFQKIVDIFGYRAELNNVCGPDSNDAIDELLYACNDFSKNNSNSIQEFIFSLESYNSSIKRDNTSADQIRIMTLHGSKGLQAPYVILCDTTSIPTTTDRFIWDKDGKSLSAKNSTSAPEYYNALKQEAKDKAYAEYLRLLYVGMTRAEDHLVVCGYKGSKSLSEQCWYELVRSGMDEIATKQIDGKLIYGVQEKGCEASSAQAEIIKPELFKPVFSKLTSNKTPIKKANSRSISPLLSNDPMGYGIVFHKILEDSVRNKNLTLMESHPLIKTLNASSQKRINQSIGKIIKNNRFNQLIKLETKTEVTIGNYVDSNFAIGRLDLMIEEKNAIYIIDYKSDKLPPPASKQVPEAYTKQLNSYKAMIQEIYPDKEIYIMILWLENGVLREVLENELESAYAEANNDNKREKLLAEWDEIDELSK